MDTKKKLLLHSCCGPCSTAVIERLLQDGNYDITVYYSNSNITDESEYEHRKAEEIRFINEYGRDNGVGVSFVEGRYEPSEYLELVKGFEEAPEGGARCSICFRMRLEETAAYAKANGFDCFDTTLTVSPYKNFDVISAIAKDVSEKYGIEYLCGNYKKKDGYKRSIELSKKYGLYRQHFCGCDFSKRSSEEQIAKKADN